MRSESLVSFPVPTAGLIRNLPPQNVPAQGLLDGLNMFVDVDGFLKPRAGYSLIAGLQNRISGSITINAGSTTGHVTLPTPQPNALYPIVIGIKPSPTAPANVFAVWAGRTPTAFDVTISADPAPGSVTLDWYIPDAETQQTGTVEFTSGVQDVTVVFADALAASDYMVTTGAGLGTGLPSGIMATWNNPSTVSFDLHISGAPGPGESYFVSWHAFFAEVPPNATRGKVTFTGATDQIPVMLAAPQTMPTYQILLGVQRGSLGTDFAAVTTSETGSGFTIVLSGAPGAETVEVDWELNVAQIAVIGEPILGGISFYDVNGQIQYVVGTPTSWWWLQQSPLTWVNITDPANPLTGNVNDQVRFIAFPFLNDIWVLGVNNHDTMRAWKPGLLTYQVVTDSPIARDLCAIGARIMVINTVEVGIRYSYRVRWSAVDDFTTWPANAVNDLSDQAQPLQAIERTNRLSAAIYGVQGVSLAIDQPGTDATAFRFEEASPPTSPGPCGPAALVSAVGLHFYLGLDARVYQFDGVSVIPISAAIDAVLQQKVSLGFASRFHATYNESLRQIWFWFVSSPDDEPRWALVYHVDAQRFETLQKVADFQTTSFGGEEQISLTWLTWATPDETWPELPYPSWAAIPNEVVPLMLLGSLVGKVYRFGFDASDEGDDIPYFFASSLQRLDPSARQIPDVWDLFLQLQPVSETCQTILSILSHPTAIPIAATGGSLLWDVSQDIPQGFFAGANAPPTGFAAKFGFRENVPVTQGVYLQMTLQGSTHQRQVWFGGSECFVYGERRA